MVARRGPQKGTTSSRRQSLTLVSCLVLELGAVAAVAGGGACSDVEDVAGGGPQARDDDTGDFGAGRGVGELLMLLQGGPECSDGHTETGVPWGHLLKFH